MRTEVRIDKRAGYNQIEFTVFQEDGWVKTIPVYSFTDNSVRDLGMTFMVRGLRLALEENNLGNLFPECVKLVSAIN